MHVYIYIYIIIYIYIHVRVYKVWMMCTYTDSYVGSYIFGTVQEQCHQNSETCEWYVSAASSKAGNNKSSLLPVGEGEGDVAKLV